ncbi:MAG: hypothetical protein WEA54_04445 [Actinomycetota bacterium]
MHLLTRHHLPRFRLGRVIAFVLAIALVAGCTGDDASPEADPSSGDAVELYAEVASADVVAGDQERLLVGLLQQPENLFLAFGEVEMTLSYLGTEEEPTEPEPLGETTGRFIPTPGGPDDPSRGAALVPPSEGRGVYQAEAVFADPGFWQVDVTARLDDGRAATGSAAFPVIPKAQLPAVGDDALRTENHVLGEKGFPLGGLDSRADALGEVPDRALHEWTIAGAVDDGVPALVSFATPAYCQSQFCGPVIDEIEDLQRRFGDRAAFIHVEIWRDFEKQVLNQAAADWLYRNDTLTEPWLFLIDAKGAIVDRWGALFDPAEVEAALERLPKLPAGTRPA